MLSALQVRDCFHTVIETNWCRVCFNEIAHFIWLEPNTNYQVGTVPLILTRNAGFVNGNRKELSWALIQLGSVHWLYFKDTLDLHWCKRGKRLAPDFLLFLIKQEENVKPLRNTAGFTNVCIFVCQCFNTKEAMGNCNLSSWEDTMGKDRPFRK